MLRNANSSISHGMASILRFRYVVDKSIDFRL